jgi:peptidoglycan L-alanyl-D-glutamate endopeptidase CwlK
MSRRLEDLDVQMRVLVTRMQAQAAEEGIDLLITCTWRSDEEQAALYAQGRTKPGKIVTGARPGQSRHNVMKGGKPASRAVDVVPLENGKCMWDPSHPSWARIAEIGEGLGLEWAGRWKRMREFPHFQLRDEA